MSECSLSGRGQGHVSNFYFVDLENFATASRRYSGDIHNSAVIGLFMTPETMGADSSRHCWVHIVHGTLPLTKLQLDTISLVRTCRISSFCTVAWQLARLLLTRRIARSLGDSWASCTYLASSASEDKCLRRMGYMTQSTILPVTLPNVDRF